MVYEIVFSHSARKALLKLDRIIQQRIIHALERIKIRPEEHLVKLVGISVYKLRVGDYRVIVDLEHEKLIILVIKVGHRKNVYDF